MLTPIHAQITPDNTLSENSRVETGCTRCIINGGTIRGNNLFHSFREFSVPTGGQAWFNNASYIQTILTRVTGNSISTIDGLLKTNGSTNLFFLNPNGIVFGPNARLEIGGSFVASTARSFKFSDGSEFSTTNPQSAPLLTINVPLGLQWGQPVGNIHQAGNLVVSPGNSLTLHGQQVTHTGSLIVEAGTVQILGDRIALLAPTQIDVSSPTGGGTVLVGGDVQGTGSLPRATETLVEANVLIRADATALGSGGNVVVWADHATRFGGTISAKGGLQGGNGGFVEVSGKQNLLFNGTVDLSAVNGQLGTLLLDPTDIVIVSGAGAANDSALPVVQASDGGDTTFFISEAALEALPGNANVILQATNNIIINKLADGTLTFAPGTGSITFQADADNSGAGSFLMDFADTIRADGRNVTISGASINMGNLFTVTETAINGGAIRLEALGDIQANDIYSGIGAIGTGRGGDVTIVSYNGGITTTGIHSGSPSAGLGDGGNIMLSAKDDITSVVLVSRTNSSGTPGTITVESSDGDIAIDSFATFGIAGGAINSFAPNGSITVKQIVAFGNSDAGGNVNFIAGKDITITNAIDARGRGTGDGGAISLTTAGNITTRGFIDTGTFSGSGQGGNIRLTSTGGKITTQSALRTDSVGGGAGQIQLTAASSITTNSLVTFASSTGNGGNITINSGGAFSTNRSLISTGTNGAGRAGDIDIQADTIAVANSEVNSGTSSSGGAGNITLRANSVNITNGSLITASTEDAGQAGNITVVAEDTFQLSGASARRDVSELSSNTVGRGNAGTIDIAAGQLILRDGAVIASTTGSVSTPGSPAGRGGALNINADVVDISGTSSDGTSPSRVASASFSNSDAGDLTVNAREVRMQAGGILATSTFGSGRSGNLTVNATERISLDGSVVTPVGTTYTAFSTDTFGTGDAGDLTLNTRWLTVQNGAAISVSTFAPGQGGTLTVNAREGVLLQGIEPNGFASGLYAQATDQGNAGNLIVRSPDVQVRDRATLTVASGRAANIKVATNSLKRITGVSVGTRAATGAAGDLRLEADQLTLDDQGQILASTDSGQGGNIDLALRNVLLMRHNSLISATAGTTQAGGDGGNIRITAPFILGVLPENSDITANAFTGRGGNINITTNGIFGLRFQPQLTPNSDITASSEFGINGTVTLNLLAIDPSQGLVSLPLNLVDPSNQISQACQPGGGTASSFVVTGRGGIPRSPDQPLQRAAVATPWISIGTSTINAVDHPDLQETSVAHAAPSFMPSPTIVEAQGWQLDQNGAIYLVANSRTSPPNPLGLLPVQCPQR